MTAHARSAQRKDHEKRQQPEGGHLLVGRDNSGNLSWTLGIQPPGHRKLGFSCFSPLPVVVCYDVPSKLIQDTKLEIGAVGFGTK